MCMLIQRGCIFMNKKKHFNALAFLFASVRPDRGNDGLMDYR
jgi:hypothetical protein